MRRKNFSCITLIIALFLVACGSPGNETPSQDSQTGALSKDIAVKLVTQSQLSNRTTINGVSVNAIEECKSLSDNAKSNGVEAAWSVRFSFLEPCQAGTQFCSADGKRPVNGMDTIYRVKGNYQIEGKTFSEICMSK